MTETPQEEPLMDAPNQQAVRPDGSGPADEGTGGQTFEEAEAAELEAAEQEPPADVEEEGE